jgi:hypothetical protein
MKGLLGRNKQGNSVGRSWKCGIDVTFQEPGETVPRWSHPFANVETSGLLPADIVASAKQRTCGCGGKSREKRLNTSFTWTGKPWKTSFGQKD